MLYKRLNELNNPYPNINHIFYDAFLGTILNVSMETRSYVLRCILRHVSLAEKPETAGMEILMNEHINSSLWAFGWGKHNCEQ